MMYVLYSSPTPAIQAYGDLRSGLVYRCGELRQATKSREDRREAPPLTTIAVAPPYTLITCSV